MGEICVSDDKIERILQKVTEVSNDVKHLTSRMDSKSEEIKELSERISKVEIQLAVNNQQTNKTAGWLDYVMKGALVLLAGYVAMKVGLK